MLFWRGAVEGFFAPPFLGAEGWRGAEQISWSGVRKGVPSEKNGACPSLPWRWESHATDCQFPFWIIGHRSAPASYLWSPEFQSINLPPSLKIRFTDFIWHPSIIENVTLSWGEQGILDLIIPEGDKKSWGAIPRVRGQNPEFDSWQWYSSPIQDQQWYA